MRKQAVINGDPTTGKATFTVDRRQQANKSTCTEADHNQTTSSLDARNWNSCCSQYQRLSLAAPAASMTSRSGRQPKSLLPQTSMLLLLHPILNSDFTTCSALFQVRWRTSKTLRNNLVTFGMQQRRLSFPAAPWHH